MRGLWASLAFILVAGCAGPASTPSEPSTMSAGASCEDPCEPTHVDAPDLAVGTFWSYRAKGVFDIEKEFTVVVARSDASGYLFAAANESQLDSLATWERVWYGERDREMNPPYPYSDTPSQQMLFDFPLYDGKAWTAWPEGPRVTAKVANITTPAGPSPGFMISGELDDLKVAWDYVPAIGAFTKYLVQRASATHDVELVGNGNGSQWVWYEAAPWASVFWSDAEDSRPHDTLQVPSGFDAVVGLAYGKSGARGGILRPGADTQPWLFEARGCCTTGDDWTTVNLPAQPGDWQMYMTSTTPGAWGEIDLMPVKWIRSP